MRNSFLKYIFFKRLLFCSLFILLAISYSSCGLDTYYYLDAPLSDGHTAYASEDDSLYFYFSCITNETSSTGNNYLFFDPASDFVYLGTDIYYKIYNNYTTMVGVESAISSLISSSSSYSVAAENLIDTRGYKPLKISEGSLSPLIKVGPSAKNRYVYIRLASIPSDSSGDYNSCICVGNDVQNVSMSKRTPSSVLTYNGVPVVPRRYINSSYGFNFSKSDAANPVPTSSDADVTYSSTSTQSGVWYVDMYAISVGRDVSYTISYSKPLLLGSVKINQADFE